PLRLPGRAEREEGHVRFLDVHNASNDGGPEPRLLPRARRAGEARCARRRWGIPVTRMPRREHDGKPLPTPPRDDWQEEPTAADLVVPSGDELMAELEQHAEAGPG